MRGEGLEGEDAKTAENTKNEKAKPPGESFAAFVVRVLVSISCYRLPDLWQAITYFFRTFDAPDVSTCTDAGLPV
jgi:hypothetical protein